MRQFKPILSRQKCIDAGMALTVMAIVSGLMFKISLFQFISLALVLVTVLVPKLLYPLALIWEGVIRSLGMITSKMILGFIFFIVVTPVALIRKLFGMDKLMINKRSKRRITAYITREHHYSPEDLINPY